MLILAMLLAGALHSLAPVNTQDFELALDTTSQVSFYFVKIIGRYDYPNARLKSEATVAIHRKCGSNCRAYMAPVLEHLMAAKPSNCQNGQQTLLIEFGDRSIVYSHSGRSIKIGDRCFYNDQSIDTTIKNGSFIFL